MKKDITTHLRHLKINEGYLDQFYANEYVNSKEMNNSMKNTAYQKWTQKETENLHSAIAIQD